MAGTPRPGRPVRGSRTGRPIMALLDLLSRRWALRVIWELREDRLTFRALQEACGGVSPTVLNERLRELRESGLLDSAGAAGYGLTRPGRGLIAKFLPLVAWSNRWAGALTRGRGTPRSSR
jgi:DNA-binding HxlR family transcriptional regulator